MELCLRLLPAAVGHKLRSLRIPTAFGATADASDARGITAAVRPVKRA